MYNIKEKVTNNYSSHLVSNIHPSLMEFIYKSIRYVLRIYLDHVPTPPRSLPLEVMTYSNSLRVAHASLSRVPANITAPRASEAILCEDVGAIGKVERRPRILGTHAEGVDIRRRGCDPVEVI